MQRRTIAHIACLGLVLIILPSVALAQYQLTNLVSKENNGTARHFDKLLVNAWGLTYAPGSPFWISDNGSGWSTLYKSDGTKQGLQVKIPAASGSGEGSPTGIVFNGSAFGGSPDFLVQGWPSIFIFATLDGTISGWAPQSNLHNAILAVTNSGSVYTGLAVTSRPSGNFLFAADNANNRVDMFDGNFKLVKSFTDTTLPSGFAPFGIQDIDGLLYVAFASTSGGPGGYIDLFSEDGTFLKHLAQGAPLNQPWGMAAAPTNFGPLSNTLLVSNNIDKDSTINSFNGITGEFVGTVRDTSGKPIHIDQLWGIEFGGGSPANGAKNELFFTAGPNNNKNGTFGSIVLK